MLLKSSIFALTISRGGAVAARWAHNPKVVGSNPASATKERKAIELSVAFLFICKLNLL